ncbi:glycosyltransferase [Myroides odoratimimus]|uniref:glycosyltransferase n=1 Tax=Myroides odoratimimus TaxID=76832 RepID=UPI00257851ED|nr:glycosyltransferase [Myroides odoratimimus]MDM1402292.1 glycosyltransferase [Myroides odoratimimus]
MKVLLISRGIPSKKDPMWGNFELDQAKAILGQGHEVISMSVDRRIRLYWRPIGITSITIDGVKMYNYFFPLPYRVLPRFIHNYLVNRFAKKLYQHIEKVEGKVDVIHGHYLPNIRIGTYLKSLFNIPVVGTEHWSELKRKKIKSSVYADAKEAYPAVDRLITVSAPLERIVKREFNVESEFVGCVIDSVFSYVPGKKDEIFRFIAVGSLFKIKGFDTAIKAFAKAKLPANVHFHIIGNGGMKGTLQQLIQSLGVENQVFLEGRKTRAEIMDFMAKSSVYVLSSLSENFATACMEALSAGVPAIMTKCGGPEDFVDDTNAVMVEVGNVEEMAKAMNYMYQNIDQYNQEEISKNIKEKYSPEAIGGQLSKTYKEIKKI